MEILKATLKLVFLVSNIALSIFGLYLITTSRPFSGDINQGFRFY